MATLRINHLHKSFINKFGERIAGLHDINLRVGEGEIVGIVGTNGAGKSTLMNCLTGQIPIDSGQIFIDEEQVDRWGQIKLAKYIGRVFQDPRLGTAPRMTVFENLMLAKKRGQARTLKRSLTPTNYQELQDYLSQFHLNLDQRLDLPIENLSGGQRQIIALMMATLQKPKILILDEHTAALDPRTAKQVMQMSYQMIRQLNLTSFMITHQLQDALDYSDRLLVLHQGRIVNQYAKDDLASLTTTDLFRRLEELMETDR
ncbi:ABC transporter ATP-binding protein [Ignavigranum ruoffiae]|uniref:Putative ABC transport system ATP-binding protein n=1 Tax=Ignavigranum ruoffiae TaxID=89093 RepID=A0A1H8Z903_9LACT|nr:ATP-binding cassette domain-containing protein [Ignavigranum ruoffiae]SEP60737.1 putative ABC transport system ATP-binding protein [Ignavigranum ruoffiae]